MQFCDIDSQRMQDFVLTLLSSLLALNYTSKKRQVTNKDSFKNIMLYYIISFKTIFIDYPAFLSRPSNRE